MKLHKTISIIALLFALQFFPMCSHNYTPLELAKEIFSNDKRINITNYVVGEYAGIPNGEDFKECLHKEFTLLKQDGNNAVVAMTIYEETGYGIDYYLYFIKESVWKMHAIRYLYNLDYFKNTATYLEQMTQEEIIRDINEKYLDSMDDYYFLLGNYQLVIETDDNIINYFLKNKEEFEQLKYLAIKELDELFPFRNNEIKVKLLKDLESEYKKLYISSISFGDSNFGLCLNFLIGGILFDKVGFIYTDNIKNLPEINPNNVIMIREIGNGWYMYKTT